jgi:aspartate aminotransferase-like enzyme
MILMTPGPTPVSEEVRVAMSGKSIHHRTPEFEAIFADTRKMLIDMFGMPEVVMLSSSGTGAMESAVTNLTHSKALTVNAGKFGERFGKICKAHNIDYTEVKYEWNTPANVEEIVKIVREDLAIDTVCIQVSESAGGLRHPVEELAKQIKAINAEITIIADGITAVGVEKIDTTNIDALIAGSQKAFMLPPGLAMIGLSDKAVAKAEKKPYGYYLNLISEIKKQRENTTAYTAATTLIIGLKKVLEMMNEKGLDNLYAETKLRAEATREALVAIGLDIYPNSPALSMTTIIDETNANAIRKILKEDFKINVAGGQDHLKGKIFRINHMGLIETYEASWVVNAVELALDKLGIREFDSTANRVFLQKYCK